MMAQSLRMFVYRKRQRSNNGCRRGGRCGVTVVDAGVTDAYPADWRLKDRWCKQSARPKGLSNVWAAQGLSDGVAVVTAEVRPSPAVVRLGRACLNVTCALGQTCIDGGGGTGGGTHASRSLFLSLPLALVRRLASTTRRTHPSRPIALQYAESSAQKTPLAKFRLRLFSSWTRRTATYSTFDPASERIVALSTHEFDVAAFRIRFGRGWLRTEAKLAPVEGPLIAILES